MDGTESVAEEIEGQRRGSCLVMADGFLYRRNYRSNKNDKDYLLCNERFDHPFCYARAIMQNGLVKITKEHNHLPDQTKVDQLKMKSRCKRRAEEETTPLREIVEEEQSGASLDVHPNFYGTLAKRRKSVLPGEPKSIEQFIEALKDNEDRFCNSTNSPLLFSGSITADDFSVATFICPSFFDIIENVDTIHVDQMYTAVPSLYKLLCTILITVNNHVYPFVYGLMTTDSEASYAILFTFIKKQVPNLKFKLAIIDFHETLHNAVKSTYPLARICGGYFHYSMAVWREVQLERLDENYIEDKNMQLCIRLMLSLPVLPPEHVEDGLHLVQEKTLSLSSKKSSLLMLLNYIQNCWINNLGLETFSVTSDPQRISMDVDSYLTKLKNKLGNSSRSIWEFIEHLKSFQESERKNYEKLLKRALNRKKTACVTTCNKVQELLRKVKFKKMPLGNALICIAMLVQPPTKCSVDMYTKVHQMSVIPFSSLTLGTVSLTDIPQVNYSPDAEGNSEAD